MPCMKCETWTSRSYAATPKSQMPQINAHVGFFDFGTMLVPDIVTGRLFYPSSCDFCRDCDPTSGIQLIFILPRKKREKSQSQSLFYEAWLTCWSITSVRPHYSSFLHFTHNITENWTCSVTQSLTHSREIALSWKRRLYSLNYRLWLTLEMLMLGNVRRKKDHNAIYYAILGL